MIHLCLKLHGNVFEIADQFSIVCLVGEVLRWCKRELLFNLNIPPESARLA